MLRRSRDFRRHLIPLAANELGPRIPSANLSEVSVHERVCVLQPSWFPPCVQFSRSCHIFPLTCLHNNPHLGPNPELSQSSDSEGFVSKKPGLSPDVPPKWARMHGGDIDHCDVMKVIPTALAMMKAWPRTDGRGAHAIDGAECLLTL